MKTKEGVAACDEAIRYLKQLPPTRALTFAATACSACAQSYQTKKSGLPIDALQRIRDTGK